MKKRDNNRKSEDLKTLKLLVISGFISFFTVISTEMVLNILPLFTVSIGGTPFILGIIAGTSSLVLYLLYGIWNWLNTQFSRKKTVLLLGGLLSNVSKPIISFSPSWQFVLGFEKFFILKQYLGKYLIFQLRNISIDWLKFTSKLPTRVT